MSVKTNLNEIYHKIKSTRERKTISPKYLTRHGNIIEDPKDICNALADQFEQICSSAKYDQEMIFKMPSKSCGFQFPSSKTTCIHFYRLRSEHPGPRFTLNREELTTTDTTKLLRMKCSL